jgi:hypothetical protein
MNPPTELPVACPVCGDFIVTPVKVEKLGASLAMTVDARPMRAHVKERHTDDQHRTGVGA